MTASSIVVKKGGEFAFHHLTLIKSLVRKTDDLVSKVSKVGESLTGVEFVQTWDAGSISRPLKLPFMIGTVEVIAGEKWASLIHFGACF